MRFVSSNAGAVAGSRARLCRCVAGLLFFALLSAAPASASSSCPNERFRTGPGQNLPDCRAYEIVSPPEKNGGEVDGGDNFEGVQPAPQQAAADGEAVTYGSQTTFTDAGPKSSVITEQYLSRRGAEGWYTQAITPEQDMPGGGLDTNQGSPEFSLFQGFTEDLEHAYLVANNPAPVSGAPAGYFNPYLRSDATNAYDLLSTSTPPVQKPGAADAGKGGLLTEYAGMSADGSHVIFAANDELVPGALPGERNLYEWIAGRLELVSVVPSTGPTSKAVFGAFTEDQGGLKEDNQDAISSDGSRVFWTVYPKSGNYGAEGSVYMSEATAQGLRAVLVSASQRTGAGPEEGTGRYWAASRDGEEVFFTSAQQLTNDSTGSTDLYRYDASTGRLSDLTVDREPGGARVESVVGVSEDGSYVYFVAAGALAAGATGEGSHLYVWHEGAVGLIATLNLGEDYLAGGFHLTPLGAQNLLESGLTRVSPSGRYLAFESSEPLTGYDNRPTQQGACEKVGSEWGSGGVLANKSARCVEVYEFDAVTGRLICASCNPAGIPPSGNANVPFAIHGLFEYAGWQTTSVQQRYLLDDGRLFFDSNDELVPQASDGLLNVYEYEPDGAGDCHLESGCVALISGGTSSDNSFFLDASADGNNVFLITRQQLVAQDGDEANDVYDARVDGGFSAATPPPCGGEACRAPVTPAPAIYQAPPSATFVGAGNPPQPSQPKTKATKKKTRHKSRGAGRKRRKKGKAGARRSGRARKSSGGRQR